MKKKLRGIKRHSLLDLDLYRVAVPVAGVANANLSVVDIHPEGADETIMFVHGYAGCAETWEHQITHFALNREYRVVVPDLRGHGQSDAPFTQYTMNELVSDMYTIAKALDLPQFTLVGHSFGGSICVDYADKYPETLERLVLIATGGEYPLPRAVSLLSRVPVAFFRLWWKYRPRWNAEVHVMKRMLLNNLRVWNGWSKMRSIRTPTLIITGERDTYFPRHIFDEVGKVIPGAEVVDIGSAKHKVQLERHHAVNRAIERFILGNQKAGSWREQGIPPGLFAKRPWLSSYPKETPYTVPIPQRPLHQFLESAAQWVPKRKATIFYGSSLTYKELNRHVNQFAHSLLGLGIAPGDRVMLAMPNTPQFIIAYYGTLKIGGVIVLPNPDADAGQIVEQARETEAKALVTLSSFGGLAQRVRHEANVHHIIFADIRQNVTGSIYRKLMERWGEVGIGRAEDEPEQATVGFVMSTLIKDADATAPNIEVQPDDLACIAYTSGTTDMPKGVRLTHENLVANTIQTRHWIPALEYGKETFLSVLPLMHSYGMTGAMNIPITMGATIVLLPVFELQQVLENIRRYRPTIFPGVPSMYMAINHAPNVRSYGLASIRACISGAAPLPIEVQEAFEKLSRGRLVEGYGLTEASPVTHANPLFGVRKVGSIGIPIPNTDAKIVDLISGEDLEPGQIGELVVKGPQVMQGYWQSDSFDDAESSLKDGWLYTGDVAIMDTDGYFTIISRKRDTIMAGDYSVYPRDVEEVLYENSKVLEVAVVGVGTSAENQQKVKAFVVPRPGSELSEAELLDLCRRRLEPYAVPWEIEFRSTLPKSFVGKILRRMLVGEQNRNGQNNETLPD